MKLTFITNNEHKLKEVQALFFAAGIDVVQGKQKIEELQTQDESRLVRDKLLKAFSSSGRPVFVEHTSLHIEYLYGFPGGLTEIFWEKLQHDRFAEVVGGFSNSNLRAKTTIGYCDGKNLHFFDGEINGHVPTTPRGPLDFQWDAVFIPDGYSMTFAEMGMDEKNKISMRRIAYDKFLNFLKNVK